MNNLFDMLPKGLVTAQRAAVKAGFKGIGEFKPVLDDILKKGGFYCYVKGVYTPPEGGYFLTLKVLNPEDIASKGPEGAEGVYLSSHYLNYKKNGLSSLGRLLTEGTAKQRPPEKEELFLLLYKGKKQPTKGDAFHDFKIIYQHGKRWEK